MTSVSGDAEALLRDARRAEDVCAAEPIHTPGSIQPHGILLAADPADDLAIVAVSANAVDLPGANGDPFAGTLASLLGSDFLQALGTRTERNGLAPSSPWEVAVTPPGADRMFDAAVHVHAGLAVIELEPADPADAVSALIATQRLQRCIAELRQSEDRLDDLAGAAVRGIRALTGYERVLAYRFDQDWHGQAISEDKAEDWPHSLLGLHFPASDIPSQARALYHTSLMRWVPSRDATPVPLLTAASRGARPVDLSHARLRSLSPTHMQYHRNLGVDGTMSLSILAGKRLWGLLVCHHRGPHRTSAGQRAAAAALADALALRIAPAERAGHETARQAEHRRFAGLISHMARVDELQAALTAGPVTIEDLFNAGGAAVVQGDTVALLGTTPPRADVLRLADRLRRDAPPDEVFATASLAKSWPDWMPHAAVASGVLAVSLGEDRSGMLMWFRPEEPGTVTWGGNPHKDPKTAMTPRVSFERWVEERRGHARAWAGFEIEMAGTLRHAIMDVVLRRLRQVATLNEQVRQSQKMEAIGQLTGGLAHDFNNLLGGIAGSLELAQTRLAQGRTADLTRFLAAAQGAAGRAAALTHRLLAFSRRQTLDPRPTDFVALLATVEPMIRRTVGPAVQVGCVTAPGLWTMLCDAGQLENALLNLALNGRDAMPGGGQLMIEAGNTEVSERADGPRDLLPGRYVAILVRDTGEGMTPEVAARAFEPFFTTKPIGLGTGLGLSMVYGFAKQSGGHVRIESAAGMGTKVQLFLPSHEGDAQPDSQPDPRAAPPAQGAATVLVVDDEPVLRMLVSEILQENGFKVIEAADGSQALTIINSPQRIDLLLSDVGLPGGLNGRQVVEAARGLRPTLKALFITGYAENAALGGGLLDANTQVLTKPFRMTALLGKVADMLR